MIELRPYQHQTIDALLAHWHEGAGNPLVDMATGTGKSVVIGEFARQLIGAEPSLRILMLVHVRELIEQNAMALLRIWPDAPLGIYSAGLGRREADAQIVYASINSVYRLDAETLGRRDIVLIDEAHRVPLTGEGMYRRVLETLRGSAPNLRVAGFTATAYRLDSGRLDEGEGRLFDRVIFSYGIGDGVRDGWLSPLVSKAAATEIDVSGVARRGGEFVPGELEDAADQDEIVEAAADEIVERGADRKSWLVFCSGVRHAGHVRDALRARGIICETVIGEMPDDERDRHIAGFRRGAIRCLTNVNVLTTGFDVEHIDMIAMLRPTLSTGLYVQMLGRGTRKAEGKINCEVLDFAGNVRRHGPVDCVSVRGAHDGAVRIDSVRAKVCPGCDSYVPPGTMTCPDCGYEWPAPKPRHAPIPDIVPVMGREPIWFDVQRTTYRLHLKPGSRPTLRAIHSCGSEDVSEFLALEHGGYVRLHAARWWRAMGGGEPVPSTVETALDRVDELDRVTALRVYRDRNFWQIAGRRVRRKEPAAIVPRSVITPIGRTIVATAPCTFCGAHSAIVEPGTSVHAAHLRCAQCDGTLACSCGRVACENPAKHPFFRFAPNGFKNATTDSRQIAEWWGQEPRLNIGIATGNVIVLDIDPRHGGFESLAALEAEHDLLPHTWGARTGSDGRHLYFAAPAAAIRNSAGRLGPGLDIRGAGGYAIAPPSLHITGNRYSWLFDPDEAPLAPVPAWLVDKLTPPPPPPFRPARFAANGSPAFAAARVTAILLAAARAHEGERNQLTFWAACRVRDMVREGAIDHSAGMDALAQLQQAAAHTGLTPREIKLAIGSALRTSS
jgi:DNA repair protein RadD